MKQYKGLFVSCWVLSVEYLIWLASLISPIRRHCPLKKIDFIMSTSSFCTSGDALCWAQNLFHVLRVNMKATKKWSLQTKGFLVSLHSPMHLSNFSLFWVGYIWIYLRFNFRFRYTQATYNFKIRIWLANRARGIVVLLSMPHWANVDR